MSLDEDIETMYNDGVTIKKMMRTLGVSYHQIYRVVVKLKAEGRAVSRSVGQKKQRIVDKDNPKHYSRNNLGTSFTIRYRQKYYGCVKTARQAERFVELMEECSWDYDKRDEVKKEVMNWGD